MSPEQAIDWFYRMAGYYSAFMPNSHRYLEVMKEETQKTLASGKEKQKEIDTIVRECAAELKAEIGKGNFEQSIINGLAAGKKGWEIVKKHLDRIQALGEDGKTGDRRPKR
jgi:hypothetical protein